jgi:hypothetical protein
LEIISNHEACTPIHTLPRGNFIFARPSSSPVPHPRKASTGESRAAFKAG